MSFRHLCELVLRHQMQVSNYFVNSFYSVLYSILHHLPSLRFHCVGGCWDRTQDGCDFDIGSWTLKQLD